MGKKTQRRRLPEDRENNLVKNFQPRTDKQRFFVDLIEDKEVVIAEGVPGSGKTFVALATALSLLGKTYKKLILVKSVTTLPDEDLGYLPGDQLQKMEPFMLSYKWNVDKICGEGAFDGLLKKKLIEILPLAFVRGLSIDNAVVIIDETQNLSDHTFKTIMTRIGTDSKYVFLGDTEQVDKKKKNESCLNKVVDIFKDSNIVGTVEFTDEDCVRNPIIPKILEALRTRGM